MARPVKEQSLAGATSAGAPPEGVHLGTGGRVTVALFVVTDVDPGTLDVQLEVSLDGVNYSPLFDAPGNKEGAVTAADFVDNEGNGEYVAYSHIHGIAADYIRPRIANYGTAGNVDVWVAASNNPRSAKNFRETGSV